ncbi:DUF3943 domain-containing protein [Vitiosangium sp. GDMCC 1.1324]|uniref:DUF3943 domain-containing protein n=1 Tax=Vitiosangium sp. (strain GDMCC 1.1324) TaxID=2138576 RepID=UPI00130D79DB|nr:DUF3943 domain-containing protein [Vitiosangium sp. GDMCC 1.1324]
MTWRGLLAALCLCGTLARAEDPLAPEPEPGSPAPESGSPSLELGAPRPVLPADAPLRRNYLVPAIEVAAVDLGLFAFHNLVSREPFALISWDTVRGHLDGSDGWTFDVDQFVTNQFAHPYHGSFIFAGARSSGVPFWQSGLYTFFSSLAWEYFAENEPPSINDQITTTLGGVFLGEVLHRTYRVLVPEGGGAVGLTRRLAGVVVSPASALNDWIFGGQMSPGDIDGLPPLYAELTPGLSLMTRLVDRTGADAFLILRQGPQISLSGELTYGAPGNPQWRYRHPFSYFDATASATFPGVSTANLNIRGLMVGAQYGGEQSSIRGLWGVFGLYDFGANDIVRVSSVGVGFGTTLQARLGEQSFLQSTAILGGLGFAAAGSLDLGPDSPLVRDYHIGPGVQAILEAKLVRRGLGMLRVRAKNWWVSGAYTEPHEGYESITYITWDGRVRVAPHVAVGFEVPLAWRIYDFGPTAQQAIRGSGLRLTLTYMSDDAFGTAGP